MLIFPKEVYECRNYLKWVWRKKEKKSRVGKAGRGRVAVAAFSAESPQIYGLFASPPWKLFVPSNKFSSFLKLVWNIPTIAKGSHLAHSSNKNTKYKGKLYFRNKGYQPTVPLLTQNNKIIKKLRFPSFKFICWQKESSSLFISEIPYNFPSGCLECP